MTIEHATVDARASRAQPVIRTIGPGDLRDAFVKGIADFEATPTHLIFLCLIYPIAMLVVARVYAGYDVLPLVFPLLAGYTLIGPLVAIGMYELSRRREQGLDTSRRHAFDVIRFASFGAIAGLSALLMVIYFAWMGTAWALYGLSFAGTVPVSIVEFARQIITTPAGWTLVFVGCGAGFIFATVTFTLSVVSFPMLVDRNVGIVTALQTSIRAVVANPLTMGMWAFTVASMLLIGSLPFLVGLAVVLPVLGHATWHLYRKLVEPGDPSVDQREMRVTG
jgi:uncharacterized membrane protein